MERNKNVDILLRMLRWSQMMMLSEQYFPALIGSVDEPNHFKEEE